MFIIFIKSINTGIKYLSNTNSYDHIQALVVSDNKIIAKEDNRGTKKMMTKLKNNSGGILIKFPKKKTRFENGFTNNRDTND